MTRTVSPLAWREIAAVDRMEEVRQALARGSTFLMAWGEAEGTGIRIRYAFTGPGGDFEGFSTRVGWDAKPDSLVPVLPAVHWDEREMQDLLGVRFRNHPDPRTLLLPEGYDGPPPLAPERPPRRAAPWEPRLLAHHGIVHVPVGPVHAGIIETGHFAFSAMGETVLQLDLKLGWDHRGLEARLAGRTLAEATSLVERTCGNCSASHQEALAQAVEAVRDTEPNAVNAAGRGLLLEMERIYNHLNDLGQLATGVGLGPLAQEGLHLKERALRLNAQAFGHRYLFGTIRPGRVRLPRDADGLREALEALGRDTGRWSDRLFSQVGFLDRSRGTGLIGSGPAGTLGAVGPVARASGLATDVRSERPYGAYRCVGYQPVVRGTGDVYARAEVRREELFGSFDLALAFLQRIRTETTEPDTADRAGGPDGIGIGMTESPRGATLHTIHLENGRIVRYHMRTASFTNWPLIMLASQDNPIGDFPLINKSFELCYACSDR